MKKVDDLFIRYGIQTSLSQQELAGTGLIASGMSENRWIYTKQFDTKEERAAWNDKHGLSFGMHTYSRGCHLFPGQHVEIEKTDGTKVRGTVDTVTSDYVTIDNGASVHSGAVVQDIIYYEVIKAIRHL